MGEQPHQVQLSMPSAATVSRIKDLLELALLLLALPYLLYRLATDPFGFARHLGKSHEN
jgi:hypothetical protein